MYKFSFDQERTQDMVLYILEKLNGATSILKLFKIIYFADQKHLARYGRPISGDTFIAMKNGPVPSATYDVVKQARGDGKFLRPGIESMIRSIQCPDNKTVVAAIPPDLDSLSESDLECIDESINENKDLSFGKLSKKSHDQAWKKTDSNPDNYMDPIEIAKAANATTEMIDYIKTRFENQQTIRALSN